jgi:hypothetical protein
MARKRIIKAAFALLLLTCLLLATRAFAQDNESALTGKVVDEEGNLIEDAYVKVERFPYRAVCLTDTGGNFVFTNLTSGVYNLTIEKRGYYTVTLSIELKPGENTYNPTLTKPEPRIPANDIVIFMLACLGAGIIILGGIFIRKIELEGGR